MAKEISLKRLHTCEGYHLYIKEIDTHKVNYVVHLTGILQMSHLFSTRKSGEVT